MTTLVCSEETIKIKNKTIINSTENKKLFRKTSHHNLRYDSAINDYPQLDNVNSGKLPDCVTACRREDRGLEEWNVVGTVAERE